MGVGPRRRPADLLPGLGVEAPPGAVDEGQVLGMEGWVQDERRARTASAGRCGALASETLQRAKGQRGCSSGRQIDPTRNRRRGRNPQQSAGCRRRCGLKAQLEGLFSGLPGVTPPQAPRQTAPTEVSAHSPGLRDDFRRGARQRCVPEPAPRRQQGLSTGGARGAEDGSQRPLKPLSRAPSGQAAAGYVGPSCQDAVWRSEHVEGVDGRLCPDTHPFAGGVPSATRAGHVARVERGEHGPSDGNEPQGLGRASGHVLAGGALQQQARLVRAADPRLRGVQGRNALGPALTEQESAVGSEPLDVGGRHSVPGQQRPGAAAPAAPRQVSKVRVVELTLGQLDHPVAVDAHVGLAPGPVRRQHLV